MKSIIIVMYLIMNIIITSQPVNSFMILSDTHHSSPSANFQESLLYEFTMAAIEEKVDFIFIAGDLVLRDRTEGANYDSLLADWKFIQDTLDYHGIKFYACRGNNDINSVEAWNSLFSGNYSLPDNGPEAEKFYTYSFTYDNFLFLSLDLYTESRRVNQMWIDEQLTQNDKPFVFAASHEPAFKVFWNGLSSYPEERDTFWTSLSNYNGKIYFCGHSHFYDHSELIDEDDFPGNNVHQIVVGTGGGGFHSDTVYNGNNGRWQPERIFHEKSIGYLLVEIDNSSISTTWKHRVAPFTFEDGGDDYSYVVTALRTEKILPTEYELFQNYPNPFNPTTTIKYEIPSSVMLNSFQHLSTQIPDQAQNDNVNVTLKVYDILGSEVATLVNERQKPGNYIIEFDATEFTSGIYFYRLQPGDFKETRKMILLK